MNGDAGIKERVACPDNVEAGPTRDSGGFTYLGVLVMVVVFGIAFSSANRYWATTAKREKEAALLYAGERIRAALGSYYGSGERNSLPSRLEHLVRDNRFPGVRRHIRKIYRNPMAEDGAWEIIRASKGKIRGVYAGSSLKPLKRAGFPKGLEEFENASTYADWKFVFKEKAAPKKTP